MSNEELVVQIQNGENINENIVQLWKQNRAYVQKLAAKYLAFAENDDLMQQCFLGMYRAVWAYKPETGNNFLTFASWCILRSIQRFIEDCCGTVRVPSHAYQKTMHFKRITSSFEADKGRAPTDRELCDLLELSGQQLDTVKRAIAVEGIGSLDVPVGEGADGSLYDFVMGSDCVEDTALDTVQQQELEAVLWPLVDALPGKAPEVLHLRFQENLTLAETARMVGITTEAARQWQARGLRELRKPSARRVLLPYWKDS